MPSPPPAINNSELAAFQAAAEVPTPSPDLDSECVARREDEAEALAAIFGDDFGGLDATSPPSPSPRVVSRCTVRLTVGADDGAAAASLSATLACTLPPAYPRAAAVPTVRPEWHTAAEASDENFRARISRR